MFLPAVATALVRIHRGIEHGSNVYKSKQKEQNNNKKKKERTDQSNAVTTAFHA